MNKLITLSEAAEYLQVSIASVRRLIRRGKLPLIKIGRSTRIDPDDLHLLICAHKSALACDVRDSHGSS